MGNNVSLTRMIYPRWIIRANRMSRQARIHDLPFPALRAGMPACLYVMCREMGSGKRVVMAVAALFCAGSLPAATTPSPTPSPSLSAEEIKTVVVLDDVSLPTPGEFFAAINKVDRPNWSQLSRRAGPLATTNRPQASLNLGTRVADGFIAVEAQDGQQVKNVGQDIISLAKGLGVSQSIIARGKSISDFADDNDWSALKEELEATEDEVKQQMNDQKDSELVTLVTVGAWLRGVQAASGVVAANYQPASAALLRQPAVVEFLISRIDSLSDKIKGTPLVGRVRDGLIELQADVSPAAIPSLDTVKAIHQTTSQLVDAISGSGAASPQ